MKPKLPQPYPVAKNLSRYARRGWWNALENAPAVGMSTVARLRPSLAALQHSPRQMAAAVSRAASAALSLHPRLNFYTFWGRLAWAGPGVRVQVFVEEPAQSCRSVILQEAHAMSQDQAAAALAALPGVCPDGPLDRLRERLPLTAYLAGRVSGALERGYKRANAPLFISTLALEGIEGLSFAPAHSMALYPGWPQDGRMRLSLCYNHQLANARPVGRFLLCIKELLQ